MSRSIARAAQILKALALRLEPVGVNELARAVRLAPATVHRILLALCADGFAEQDAVSGKYGLGSEVVPLALRYLNRRQLGDECLPLMRHLANDVGESVNLGILSNNNAVYYVHQVEGPNPLRFALDVGLAVPLHCSALGKLLLAFSPEPVRSSAIAKLKLEKRTDRTITNRARLLQELDAISRDGFAVDTGENVKDLIGLAVPVRDWNSTVAAGLSIMGPSLRLSPRRIKALVPQVMDVADQLSNRLGWRKTGKRPVIPVLVSAG